MSRIDKSPSKIQDNPDGTNERILDLIARAGGATSGTIYRAGVCGLSQQAIDNRLERLTRRGAIYCDRAYGVKIFRLAHETATESESRRTALAGGDQHD
ncbi:hypothetical protein Metli_1029 [Methanofollis liminatans DSM 4140]|uniref:Uncharacterized protein n=1 Tax=Methanofollis liminatans DSM 4140 TaxID=28892 RepID=J1L1T3_9EURY|nr:helix-turn-helix transcriptional regulator [Methanofollis liminatans]EJG06987.1 hypothetical protein Metli_1029 [Methanofollis liminatans DSM 4140]